MNQAKDLTFFIDGYYDIIILNQIFAELEEGASAQNGCVSLNQPLFRALNRVC